jgi:hypothetical protein
LTTAAVAMAAKTIKTQSNASGAMRLNCRRWLLHRVVASVEKIQ